MLAAAVGGLATADPSRLAAGPILCLFRRTTGVPCPSCGLTRATAHLLHGDLVGALRLHPLAPLVLAVLAAGWALAGVRLARGRSAVAPGTGAVAIAGALVLVAVWALRLVLGTLP